MALVVKRGDITQVSCDAIVNPANSFGYMGGGVAGAIKRVGGVEIEKEASRIIREGEKFSKISRTRFATRFIRPLARIPRLLKVFAYYEKPTGEHHLHENNFK